jgi:nucleoside-diphosphate-sugar epimerase
MTYAQIVEGFYQVFYPQREPVLTRYGISVLSDHFTLDISKAKEKLNYRPVMTTQEGVDEFVQWYKKL